MRFPQPARAHLVRPLCEDVGAAVCHGSRNAGNPPGRLSAPWTQNAVPVPQQAGHGALGCCPLSVLWNPSGSGICTGQESSQACGAWQLAGWGVLWVLPILGLRERCGPIMCWVSATCALDPTRGQVMTCACRAGQTPMSLPLW